MTSKRHFTQTDLGLVRAENLKATEKPECKKLETTRGTLLLKHEQNGTPLSSTFLSPSSCAHILGEPIRKLF